MGNEIPQNQDQQAGIEITPEMKEAGLNAYDQLHESYPAYLLVVEIYKAMESCK